MGVVAGMAAVLMVGQGLTGRATGGEADVGCGDGPSPSEPVGQQEGAVYFNPCFATGRSYGQACCYDSNCASGLCAVEHDGYDNPTKICTKACTTDSQCTLSYSGDHYCASTTDADGRQLAPVCLDAWARETWRPTFGTNCGGRIGCSPSPSSTATSYCYVSSGTTWCQDYYSGKWCTSAGSAYGYDWTACNWSGWNSSNLYCSGGWLWDGNGTHKHCP